MEIKKICIRVWNYFQTRCGFQVVFHWVSKPIHLTRIRCSGWVRAAWMIEFENIPENIRHWIGMQENQISHVFWTFLLLQTEEDMVSCSRAFRKNKNSLQNRRNFLRILGEKSRKRGKRVASAKRKLRARGGSLKNHPCPHTIVQAVPAFKCKRGYLIGYFETGDPQMLFQDVTQSRTVIWIQQIDSR